MTPVSLQQHMNGFDAVVDKQLLHVTCGDDADQHMRKTQFAATSIVCTGTSPGTPAVEAVPISHNMHLPQHGTACFEAPTQRNWLRIHLAQKHAETH